jgi:8-oxo-dGTP pyrophosphatase MutT (NUDIX family)
MSIPLESELLKIAETTLGQDVTTQASYVQRITQGAFSRDENPESHFCVYFLPYNKAKREVFIIHHKKSGLWLSPGGHIDKGENTHTTLNREIAEELGVKNFFTVAPTPFLITITPIEKPSRSCKIHFDVWYLMKTDGSNFAVDPREFHTTRWLSIEDAKKVATNAPNIRAFEEVEKFHD